MSSKFKSLLKKFLPSSASTNKYYSDTVLEKLDEGKSALEEKIDALEKKLLSSITLIDKKISALSDTISRNSLADEISKIKDGQAKIEAFVDELEDSDKISALYDEYRNSLKDILQNQKEVYDESSKRLESIQKLTETATRNASEAVWAEVFNNTISNSDWLKDKSFSPGQWSVGYPYLYAMFRTLNIAKPKRILDLGLGQTSKMLAQYATANEDVEHIVLEDCAEWIEVFKNDNLLSPRTKIILSELSFINFKDDESVRVYKSFKETVGDKKFDFISIDGPLGGDMKKYSRIDVLNIIPQCLSESFVIMMHDTERVTESNTLKEIEHALRAASIKFRRGRYNGKKDAVLLCSEQPGYLTTL